MLLINLRKAIGIQRMLSLGVIVLGFFIFTPTQPPLHLPLVQNLLAFACFICWVFLIGGSGWELFEHGMPTRIQSLVSIALIFALAWLVSGHFPTSLSNWLPSTWSPSEIASWFALSLSSLLCLVEIVLPTPRD